MSGIADLEQPAKLWLSDVIKNLALLARSGDEPSMDFEVKGQLFEFRVKPETIDIQESDLQKSKS